MQADYELISNIKFKKEGCATARNFNSKCHSSNSFIYLLIKIIDRIDFTYESCNIEDILCDRQILTVLIVYQW